MCYMEEDGWGFRVWSSGWLHAPVPSEGHAGETGGYCHRDTADHRADPNVWETWKDSKWVAVTAVLCACEVGGDT